MSIRVLIADDEPLARKRLRHLLLAKTEFKIVGESATGPETITSIANLKPDLVLLDVDLPVQNGFQVMHSFDRKCLPVIILVTAHEKFAVQAFDTQVTDYLLKPIAADRFHLALKRAQERLQSPTGLIGDLSTEPKTPSTGGRFAIKSRGRIQFVKWRDIEWISSADNYSELHAGTAVHLLRQSLTDLERQLQEHQFVRIGRSYLVNMDFVKEFRPKTHGDYLVLLRNGQELPGSRNFRGNMQKAIDYSL